MSAPSVSLGYVILYVKDVSATLVFYEEAFSLPDVFSMMTTARHMESWRLERPVSPSQALNWPTRHLKQEVVTASLNKPPLGFEIHW